MTIAAKSCPAKIRVGGRAPALGGVDVVDQLSSLAGSTRCGERLSTVNGPATRTRAVVDIGLIVEIFDIRARGDAGVDFLLPGDARFPPSGMNSGGCLRPRGLQVRAVKCRV